MNHVIRPLSSAGTSIYSTEISKISNYFNFFEVFKDCFNKYGYSLDDVNKNSYSRPS